LGRRFADLEMQVLLAKVYLKSIYIYIYIYMTPYGSGNGGILDSIPHSTYEFLNYIRYVTVICIKRILSKTKIGQRPSLPI